MADGGAGKQYNLDIQDEISVDTFAGGGGLSTGYEMATGLHVDYAVNHNADALSMHAANHPQTVHLHSDVREVDPHAVARGRPVGYFHLSPDCTHHSQASGGQPRDRKTRALSWVGKRWCGQVAPRVFTLENVKQVIKWGPLIAKRDPATGRVLKRVETVTVGKRGKVTRKTSFVVAAPGERVSVHDQYLIPDPRRAGQTWNTFVADLRAMGYVIEWRLLNAQRWGAGTTRERLFMCGRRDGEPIVWPAPTHASTPARGQRKESVAADHIDFTLPCHSIFLSTAAGRRLGLKRPLEDSTLTRIATGVVDYVIESDNPFIVPEHRRAPVSRGEAAAEAPILVKYRFNSKGARLDQGLPTITGGGNAKREAGAAHAMGVAIAQLQRLGTPGPRAAHLVHLRNNCDGRSLRKGLKTISAGGEHHGVVECTLSRDDEGRALRVAGFLMRYHSSGGQWASLADPLTTVTTKDRLALVTVYLKEEPYVIVDIRIRMLTPRELYLCQGFPADYLIDRGHDGRVFSKAKQIRMCGNSVSPPPAAALIAANYVPRINGRSIPRRLAA